MCTKITKSKTVKGIINADKRPNHLNNVLLRNAKDILNISLRIFNLDDLKFATNLRHCDNKVKLGSKN